MNYLPNKILLILLLCFCFPKVLLSQKALTFDSLYNVEALAESKFKLERLRTDKERNFVILFSSYYCTGCFKELEGKIRSSMENLKDSNYSIIGLVRECGGALNKRSTLNHAKGLFTPDKWMVDICLEKDPPLAKTFKEGIFGTLKPTRSPSLLYFHKNKVYFLDYDVATELTKSQLKKLIKK